MRGRGSVYGWVITFMLSAALSACAVAPSSAPGESAPVAPSSAAGRFDAGPLTVAALKNATYSGIYDEAVTLSDGLYEGEPFVAGDASRPTVAYADGAERYGDLDGDGVDDAVVFLVENSGGTGNFVYVAAQLNRDGRPVDAGAVWIEDRIQVRSAAIDDGQVVLEIITDGPGDAACCKSHKASKRYALQDGRLVEIPGEAGELQRVSAADLDGTNWTLIELSDGQPVSAEPPVMLTFQDGRISGSGGCNDYTGPFTLGEDNPFVMTVGPVAATAMACPDSVQSQENAYFSALGTVSQWSYRYGNLAMYSRSDDGSLARLLFAPAPAHAGATDLDALTAHSWQWVSFSSPLEAFDVDTPASYTLIFGQDGIVEIVADCNTAIASYGVDGTDAGSLSMSVAPRTTDICPPDSRGDQFLSLLGGAAGYSFEGDRLLIDLMADGGTLAFAPGQAEPGAAVGDAPLPRVEPLAECFAQPPADLTVTFDIDCGYVVVPESADDANSRELKLGFTRLNSGQESTGAPLFMLAGGPGQTNISPDLYRLFQPELLGGILTQRDVVILEQRGTQYTDTFLDCPVLRTAPWTAYTQGLQGKDADDFAYAELQGCIDDFKAQGINFDAYNSVENAADVYLARAALGYDQIIYYGASYGAQLGQHIMRDYPFMLEAVVLDGAEALSRRSWVENRALDAQWGIDNLTALCAADAKCAATYDIPALVDAALALFDDGPLPYTYTDPADPTLTVTGEITIDDMVGLIYQLQGDLIGAMSLPATLAQLTGSAEAATEVLGSIKGSGLLAGRDAGPSPMAILMHMAMVCSDDPVNSVDDVKLDGVGRYATLFGQAGAEEYAAFCAAIGVASLPDDTDVDVTTDVPALLLGGDLDVATPTFRSREVADGLPHATLIVFPGRTHVQIAGVNLCAGQIMTQFVLDPTASLDTSCTAESPLLGFVLPDGSMSKEGD